MVAIIQSGGTATNILLGDIRRFNAPTIPAIHEHSFFVYYLVDVMVLYLRVDYVGVIILYYFCR